MARRQCEVSTEGVVVVALPDGLPLPRNPFLPLDGTANEEGPAASVVGAEEEAFVVSVSSSSVESRENLSLYGWDSQTIHNSLLVGLHGPQLLLYTILEELDGCLDGGLMPPPLSVGLPELGHLLDQAIMGDLKFFNLSPHSSDP